MGPIIFFDGVCNLCNWSVDFIIKRDPTKKFIFASLQSTLASEILDPLQFSVKELLTLVLLKDGRVYTRSNAALEICRNLSGLWPLCYGFKIVPLFLRDAVYRWISKNRYKWFGMRNQCRIPSQDEMERFLPDDYTAARFTAEMDNF